VRAREEARQARRKREGTERGICFARSSKEGEERAGEREEGVRGKRGVGIVTRELKVLLRSSLSPSNLHWS